MEFGEDGEKTEMEMPLVAQCDNHSIYWELMVYSSRLFKRPIKSSMINNRLIHFLLRRCVDARCKVFIVDSCSGPVGAEFLSTCVG